MAVCVNGYNYVKNNKVRDGTFTLKCECSLTWKGVVASGES